MTEPSERELVVFSAARRLAVGERVAYLDEACAGNAALRQRVEELLWANDEVGAFLQEPALGAERTADALTSRNPLQPAEKISDRIGRYKLLQQIGEGGCGVVYMAEQEEPVRRRVALKVIKLGMDTRSVIARFEAERQALALMDHPNIAKVLDAGATDTGRPYFVMELVKGIKITDYCDQNNLPTGERLDLFVQVCQAVQHAHQKGIIHRDLKPSNILVTSRDGVPVPKVIDFGIAKATTDQRLTDQTLFTAFEQFIGTPAYMSPEQAETSELGVDTRSDIYSLGVLLYELLTSRTPFDATELLRSGLDAMRRTIRQKEPARPSTRLRTMFEGELTTTAKHRHTDAPNLIHLLRGDLDWIVMKCLEKDRARRYETANGLTTDIQRHLKNEPVVARPPSNLYRFQKFIRRNKLAFVAASGIAMVLALGFAGILWQWRRAERNAGTAIDKLGDAYIAQAQANRRSDGAGRRYHSLTAISNAAVLQPSPAQRDALRNEAIASFALTDVRVARQWPAPENGAEGEWRFDSRLQLYAHQIAHGEITIRQVSDDHEVARLPTVGSGLNWIHFFSRDSRFLSVKYRNETNYLWDITHQKIVLTAPERDCWALSPDSRLLAASHPDGILSFYSTDTSEEVRRVSLQAYLRHLLFHPDGTKIAGVPPTGDQIEIVDVDKSETIARLWAPGRPTCLAFSGDGRSLVAGTDDGRLYVWDITTTEIRLNIDAHQNHVTSSEFNHAGTLLASVSWDASFHLWEALTGRLLISGPGGGVLLQFAADDGHIGYADGRNILLCEIAPHPEFRLLAPDVREFNAWSLAFSAGGRLLVSSDQDIHLRDMATGTQLASIPDESPRSVLFHPDGKSLITSGAGLDRRSLQWDYAAATNTLRIGPRTLLTTERDFLYSNISPDGRFLVAAQRAKAAAVVLDFKNPSALIKLKPHPGIQFAAISPDGGFVATGTWGGSGVKVWDVATRQILRELPTPSHAKVAFSPDGRWLATSAEDYRLYEVGSWQLRFTVSVPEDGTELNDIAFSPDGEVWAIGNHPRSTHLYATATGRRLAVLEPPQQSTAAGLAFSPDGATLAILQRDRAIQLWDLRRIRVQLATLNLDWEQPPYPPAVAAEIKPIRIELAEDPIVAERRSFLAREILVRPPGTDPRLIDLSGLFNASLTESWHDGIGRSDLSELTAGLHDLVGVHFDVRGLIQVEGISRARIHYPRVVTDIPVHQSCARLHFLHSAIAAGSTPAGIAIGNYRIHYSDGRQIEIPIILGKDVTDWSSRPEEDSKDLVVAWVGANERSRQTGQQIRLFKTTWVNPLPAVAITRIDFVCGSGEAKPFLVAITAE